MSANNEIMSIMQQIRDSAKNLSKDLDKNDSREKTQEDLEQLTLSFQDLKDIYSALNEQDSENLNREAREWLSGKEDFQTYMRDVKKIIMDIKTRINSDKKVEEKVADNLPEDHQNEAPSSLVQGFQNILEKIAQWTEKAGSR
ncbi:MAG: hypothetical protein H0T62_05205 [Parachlamydiaceae bacterium]|nr:hypothetical protein [Parachlamydiaceae bacterium]